MTTPVMPTELSQAQLIKAEISKLQEALLKQMPEMPSILRTIHKQLKENPDCVTLLTEEEIGQIVLGLEKHTGAVIVADTVKKQSTTGAKAVKAKVAQMNLDEDL
jgi:hypothetical protein